jgi:hypothetical protein
VVDAADDEEDEDPDEDEDEAEDEEEEAEDVVLTFACVLDVSEGRSEDNGGGAMDG